MTKGVDKRLTNTVICEIIGNFAIVTDSGVDKCHDPNPPNSLIPLDLALIIRMFVTYPYIHTLGE